MSERLIHNPVLRGFHPDPSILRVGHDYCIANTTFEWHPGIELHHSRDLIDWELIGHVFTTAGQLDKIREYIRRQEHEEHEEDQGRF